MRCVLTKLDSFIGARLLIADGYRPIPGNSEFLFQLNLFIEPPSQSTIKLKRISDDRIFNLISGCTITNDVYYREDVFRSIGLCLPGNTYSTNTDDINFYHVVNSFKCFTDEDNEKESTWCTIRVCSNDISVSACWGYTYKRITDQVHDVSGIIVCRC